MNHLFEDINRPIGLVQLSGTHLTFARFCEENHRLLGGWFSIL